MSNYNNNYSRSPDNSRNGKYNYPNRQSNNSQSPHRNNTQYQHSYQNYRSSTPKHQRQIKKVQSTEQILSDPPGIDNTESSELQLNHIICEFRDDEIKTEKTISIKMLKVEIEYEVPTESNFYHIHENFSNFDEQIITQKKSDYTKQKLE